MAAEPSVYISMLVDGDETIAVRVIPDDDVPIVVAHLGDQYVMKIQGSPKAVVAFADRLRRAVLDGLAAAVPAIEDAHHAHEAVGA